ncbi:4-hydroxyacetophenone monooxygenase [Leucobacter exalbidus]|uniref:4-hydroxyacetophenone monooxygenase n=1 Tax=Leucobacter exalbidus TaxID=662960 RepID=A0A940T3N6_9MICO|nr:NAD(P)/FAD-dependent oxidoreductase [Leucobacter exalbidus]MBP1326342.1 4-hydroxyacetophenone monooxygenase [Leucobacter exalbidus]
MSQEQQSEAREIALTALRRVRDEQLTSASRLSEHETREILSYLANGDTSDSWYGLLTHELDLAPAKNAAPDWQISDFEGREGFEVLVVGAGLSGIAAAYRLNQAEISFTQIETSHTLGGTWWKNHYPGVRLDTPTFGYSFSFAQRTDWPHQFAEGHEVREYLESVAERGNMTDSIEFNTALVSAIWDEKLNLWHATTRDADGSEQVRDFNAIITGVGQLDHPFIPEYPGQDTFAGVQMHSQEWQHDVSLAGKKVAVIGTGASAYQIAPAIVDDVEKLAVFQRSAPWMLPAPTYHNETSEAFRWLCRKVPYYGQWFRLWMTLLGIEGRIHTVTAEPDWEGAPLSVSPTNEKVRQEIIGMLRDQLNGDEELLERMTPSYPPGAKRMLRDNGVWSKTITAPQTSLVSTGISHFTPSGIVTLDGEEVELDVIIYATGFRPSDYLDPIQITGRGGVEIHDYWDGDARAFAGITVPGFPNLYMLMGPNTGGVVAGGLYFMVERAVEYALKSFKLMFETQTQAIDVTPQALDQFIADIDAENNRMAWGQPYVKTWYKNAKGRVSQVWPFPITDYWTITEQVNPEDYEFLR